MLTFTENIFHDIIELLPFVYALTKGYQSTVSLKYMGEY